MAIRVVVIEDHPLMMKAVEDLLAGESDIDVVGKATHGSELTRLVKEHRPDVVILDLGMSEGYFEPISAVRACRKDYPHVQVLVLTGYDDDVYVREMYEAGALGYVLKSDNLSLTLAKGVRAVFEGRRFHSEQVVDKLLEFHHSGDTELTDQELGILRLAARGLSNTRIASIMNLSEKRVRNVFSSIYDKLDVSDRGKYHQRSAAINIARRKGWLPED